MKKIIVALFLILFTISCEKVKRKTKATLNKSGETIGESATEFFEGVSEGVDKSLLCEISLSKKLISNGIKTGKFSIENDKSGGKNNVLAIYLIFENNIKTTLTAKVFDKNNLEMGRTKLEIEAIAGDAGYYDFTFDKRTYIEVKSIIKID